VIRFDSAAAVADWSAVDDLTCQAAFAPNGMARATDG